MSSRAAHARRTPEPSPSHSAARACFLCGADAGPTIFCERWPITGLGTVEIGYRVCGCCGAVRQDPALAPEAMAFLYRSLSNYTNPGRAGRPGPRKIQAVARQLAHLRTARPQPGRALHEPPPGRAPHERPPGRVLHQRPPGRVLHQRPPGRALHQRPPGRALQVGSSDGYTLSALRRAGWQVQGLDPSPAAARLAATLWDVPTYSAAFEDFVPAAGERWDCVVMTHVLEHLYHPVAALVRAFDLLAPDGLVLLEVPCLTRPETWPPGFFTLEHVNYFSAETLAAAVARAGGALASGPELEVDAGAYPVVRCTARPVASPAAPPLPTPHEVRALVDVHVGAEARAWARVDQRLREVLADGAPVVVYGAGIHTSQLFARTLLGRCERVRAILDSDPQKWGVCFDRWRVAGPEWLAEGHAEECSVVISSFQAEDEIRAALEPLRDRMRRLVTLYDGASFEPA